MDFSCGSMLYLSSCIFVLAFIFYAKIHWEVVSWYTDITIDLIMVLFETFGRVLMAWWRFFYKKRKDLSNEIVLITGAAGIIGQALAKKIAKKGCTLALLDIDEEGLSRVCDSINTSSIRAHAYVCDIRKSSDVEKMYKDVVAVSGHPTIIINNAGVVAGKYFLDLHASDIQRTFDVNVLSNYWLVRKFLPHMLETDHGHVICISSILALDSMAGVSEYGPSKAASFAFMRSLRQEIRLLGRSGVHCTTVLPYLTDTHMFKGCAIRFKNFPPLNVLQPSYVADKIIEAIETNQITLFIPRVLYVITAMMSVLPDRANDALMDFLRVNSSMKTFVGRDENVQTS